MTGLQQSDPIDTSHNAELENSNVSERERAEEALAREILYNTGNLVLLKDAEGRYLFVNRQFEKDFPRAPRGDHRQKDDEIFPPEQAAAFRANDLRVLQAGVPMEFEEATFHDDGTHTSIVHKFPLINTNGKVYATGSIVTDITERKRAERALRERGRCDV